MDAILIFNSASSCPCVFSAHLSSLLLHFLHTHFLSMLLFPLPVFSQLPPFLWAICHYHCPKESLACLLYFKSPVCLYFPYSFLGFPSPSAFLSCSPLCNIPLAHPTLIAFHTLHPILHFALLAASFSFFPSFLQILFLFHNWQTCTRNILEKYHFELLFGNPRTTVCFHPTVGLWTGPISFGLMGAVWILTGTICLPQSWFLRDVQRKLMTCWYPTAYLLSCSHMHYKITCGKKSSR